MASPNRRGARDLIAEIIAEGPRFNFFQAVRLLALDQVSDGIKTPVPGVLRFSSKLSLGFPASQIDRVTRSLPATRKPRTEASAPVSDSGAPPSDNEDASLDMTIGFMGLVGPSGALPVSYTELLIDRRNHSRDGTAHAFLDIFTHRAVSLFYEAWRKYRFYLPHEAGSANGFSRNVLDIVGLGLLNLRHQLPSAEGAIPDLFLIHYAGLLSQRPIPAANIEAIVRGFFGVDARLEQFAGQWMKLPEHEQSALISGRNCILGLNSFVGERIWDRQNKMRLRLGPLDERQFARFMPGRQELHALRDLVRFCSGLSLDCEITLILKHDRIPAPILHNTTAPCLGYSLWLNSLPPTEDRDDVSFTLLK